MTVLEGEAYRRQLTEYLEVPLRRPRLVLVPMALGMVLALAATFLLPKEYSTSTLILVEQQKVPQSVVRNDAVEAARPRLLTIHQEILSRTRLEKVIRELDPYPAMMAKAPLTKVIERMRGAISIRVQGNDAFTIEYVHRDPQKAMMVANRLAGLFIEEVDQAREEQVEGAAEFIETQLQESRRRLEETEQALRAFKEEHMGHLPEQTPANLATLQRLQMEQHSVSESLRAARERQLTLEKSLGAQIVSQSGEGATATAPGTELSQLRAQLAALRGRYTDEHPDVRVLIARIAQIERRLAERVSADDAAVLDPTTSTRSQLERARSEVRSFEARGRDLDRQIAMFQERVEAAPRAEQNLNTLTRDHRTLNESYLNLLNKKLDAQMAEKLEQRWKGERFKVLDPAYLPEESVFPNRPLFGMAGVALGLVIGLVLSFVAEYFDHSIKSPQELETVVPFPVLATFPHIDPGSVRAGAPPEAPPRPGAGRHFRRKAGART